MRQAVAVGSAVAVMHTASVLALGLLVLRSSRRSGPRRCIRGSGSLSGLVALGLGAYLLISRLSAWSERAARRAHDRRTRRTRSRHDHRPCGSRSTTGTPHALPAGVSLTSRRGLMALALAGGILPAPSALIVMLGAINAHRVGYGLALMLAFSVGLAPALIVVGLGRAARARGHGAAAVRVLGTAVPVLSAVGDRGRGVVPRRPGRNTDLARPGARPRASNPSAGRLPDRAAQACPAPIPPAPPRSGCCRTGSGRTRGEPQSTAVPEGSPSPRSLRARNEPHPVDGAVGRHGNVADEIEDARRPASKISVIGSLSALLLLTWIMEVPGRVAKSMAEAMSLNRAVGRVHAKALRDGEPREPHHGDHARGDREDRHRAPAPP